jgi:hypothetical protein
MVTMIIRNEAMIASRDNHRPPECGPHLPPADAGVLAGMVLVRREERPVAGRASEKGF